MLAIEVEYLMGRAIATQVDERNQAEWPPHPQRLFSALVAAYAELGLGAEARAALEWLESLPPPSISADLSPSWRQVTEHFVPVNDEAVRSEKGKVDFRHPFERRNRQSRFFPAVVPRDPVITFQWDQASETTHQPALRTLVENLTYLGHSASPIRACLRGETVEPTLVPDDEGDYELRTPGPGRLRRLEAVHQQRLVNEAMQPPLGQSTPYGRPSQPHSVFSTQALVVSFAQGPKLSLDASLPLMQRLRDALLARLNERLPASLCGHDTDGNPSRDPHLALIPLAFVDARHADGSLKGAALVLPRALEPSERRHLRAAIDEPWLLHLGSLGSISMQLLAAQPDDLQALQFTKWYASSATCWASVTPVVLDRHPKKNGATAEAIIAESCVRIGLPRPVEVRIGNTSVFKGAPPVHMFLGRSSRTAGRPMQHVLVRFAGNVRGPVLLGAGRFFGMGLCRPWTNRRPG